MRKIKEWRALREVSQREAARRAGIRQQTWSDIENGYTARPHPFTLKAIARTLRCRVEDLDQRPPEN